MTAHIERIRKARRVAGKMIKVPRKVEVRRSAYREHRNKYTEFSKYKHNAFGVMEE